MLRGLVVLLLVLLSCPALAEVRVRDVRLGLQDGGGTRFVLETDKPATYRLFFLNNPPRAVIDFPSLAWNERLAPASKGLVKTWRHGQFGEGTRVVLDLSGPASFGNVQAIPTVNGDGGQRLVLDLKPAAGNELADLIGRNWGEEIQSPQVPSTPAAATTQIAFPLPPALPSTRRGLTSLPLVVIDAGHGGVDPGALSPHGHREKALTLAMAKLLESRLKATGHYRVSLTRSRDVFVPLKERVAIARRRGADLFISLHADSIQRRDVQGATIYTLSDRSSDEEANDLAENENRADILAGLEQAGDDDGLAGILTDMSYRASVNHGHEFSGLLAQEMGKVLRMTQRPQRSAGFAVLKAPDIPSVLVEMGYMSSPTESRLLHRREHQDKLVSAIVRATDRFFVAHNPTFEAQMVLR